MAQSGIVCPQCATMLAPGTRFCGECGAQIPTKLVEPDVDAPHTILGIDAEAVRFAAALAEAESKAKAEAEARAQAEAEEAKAQAVSAEPAAGSAATAQRDAPPDAGSEAETQAESKADAASAAPPAAAAQAVAELAAAVAASRVEPAGQTNTGATLIGAQQTRPVHEHEHDRDEPDGSARAAPSNPSRSVPAAVFAPERGTPAAARAAVQNSRRSLAHTMLGLSDEMIRNAGASATPAGDSLPRGITPLPIQLPIEAPSGAEAPSSDSKPKFAAKGTLLGIQYMPDAASAPGSTAGDSRSFDKTQIEGEPLQDPAVQALLAASTGEPPLTSTRLEVEGSRGTALGLGVPDAAAPKRGAPKGRTMLGVPLASLAPAAAEAIRSSAPPTRASAASSSAPPGSVSRPSIPGRTRSRFVLLVAGLALLAIAAMVYLRISGQAKAADVSARIVAGEDGETLVFDVPDAANGAVIRFGGQEQPLVGGHATFALASDSLRVGENVVLADVVGPDGDTASARIVLSVFYRIWVDTSSLRVDKPTVDVVVNAVPGTKVTLDGESVPLDEQGHATKAYPLDISHVGKGGSVEHVVHYRMQPPKGETVVDELHTRIPLAMMQIERPGPDIVTDQDSIEIAGVVGRDTQVDIDGASVPVTEGRFSYELALPKPADYRPRVTATAEGKIPYAVTLTIMRVRDLAQAAREFTFDKSLNYAKIAADPNSYRGQSIAMEGRVYATDPRAGSSVIQMLARPCPSAQRCSVWVVDPQGNEVAVDRWIRVLGIVDGEQQFRSEKNEIVTVPKIIARFVLPAKS